MNKDPERNIVQEYRYFRQKLAAPYILEDPKAVKAELKEFGITIPDRHQSELIIRRNRNYLLVISTRYSYLIKDSNYTDGARPIGDKLIISRRYQAPVIKDAISALRALKNGYLRYERWDRGRFGAVLLDVFDDTRRYPWAIKLYNYAFLLNEESWNNAVRRKFEYHFNREEWNLSGVTGIGTLIAYDVLRSLGYRVPDAPLATSDVLVQEYIDGITVADIFDRYEELKDLGVLGESDEIIDRISDFATNFPDEVNRNLVRALEQVDTFWTSYYLRPDVNWGNIMIPWDGLSDPESTYYIIDPIY